MWELTLSTRQSGCVLTDKSQMNIGIFFAIIAVVVIWFLMKTTLGFVRAVGLNANAAGHMLG